VKDSVSRRDNRRTFLTVVGVGLAIGVIAAPLATAGHGGHTIPVAVKGQPIGVKGTVTSRIQGSAESNEVGTSRLLETESIADMGLTGVEGSQGALAVRTYGGGGGLLAFGDCDATVSGTPPIDPLNTATLSDKIITALILTGTDGKLVTTSGVAPGHPILQMRVDGATNPNEFIGLGNGLSVSVPLTFTCTGENGPAGDGEWVILGQDGN
jgi:hypothetical protein